MKIKVIICKKIYETHEVDFVKDVEMKDVAIHRAKDLALNNSEYLVDTEVKESFVTYSEVID